MTTTHELLRQARALLDRAFWRQPEVTALIVLIDAHLSAPQQTPEAWGCFGPDGKLDPDLVGTKADCESWRDADDAENKWTVAPLYTSLHHLSAGEPAAPQAAAQPVAPQDFERMESTCHRLANEFASPSDALFRDRKLAELHEAVTALASAATPHKGEPQAAAQPISQRTLNELTELCEKSAGRLTFDEIQIERVPLGTKATYLQNNQPVCWLTVEHSASPGVVVSLRGITGSIEVKLGAHD